MGAAAPPSSSSSDQMPRSALSFLGITMLVRRPRQCVTSTHIPTRVTGLGVDNGHTLGLLRTVLGLSTTLRASNMAILGSLPNPFGHNLHRARS